MPVTQTISSATRGATARWRSAGTIRRTTLILGTVGITAGAGLVTAGLALAAVGHEPGNLVLALSGLPVTSGQLTDQPNWGTTDACPSGFQQSADISEFTLSGTYVSVISETFGGPTSPIPDTGPTAGILDASVGALLGTAGSGLSATHPGTDEWAVGCYAETGGVGNVCYQQSLFVTANADGTYSTSATPPSGTTSTPTACQSASASASASASPSASASASASASPSASASASASASPSSTPTATSSQSPPPTSTVLPSGAPATGAGGASLPGGSNGLLIALGIAALVGSAAAMGLALRRREELPGQADHGDIGPGATS